jgi:hypothetical protein
MVTSEQLERWEGMCDERERRLRQIRAGGDDRELDYVERGLASMVPALIAEVKRLQADREQVAEIMRVYAIAQERAKNPDGCTIADFQRIWLDQKEDHVKKLEAEVRRLTDELSLWKPMTPEEAEKAYDEAEAVPMAPGEAEAIIETMMASINDPLYRPTEPEYVQLVVEIRKLRKENAGLKLLHAIANHVEGDE